MFVCTYVCMYVCMYVRTYVCMYVFRCEFINIYAGSMCMFVCLNMFYLPREPQACMPGCIRTHVYLCG